MESDSGRGLSLVLLIVSSPVLVFGEKDILRLEGNTVIRLGTEGGRLVMDEGDIEEDVGEEPLPYRRYKRISHAKDYNDFLSVQSKPQNPRYNEVDVDSVPLKDFTGIRGISETGSLNKEEDFVGIRGMLETGSLDKMTVLRNREQFALGNVGFKDDSSCLQKYLCEIGSTSKSNLMMEEAALLAMVRSQAEIQSLIQSHLQSGIKKRNRRSSPNLDQAFSEAAAVADKCNKLFPTCGISRLDILRVYKHQKDSFCNVAMPYGM